jgi:hypothetical protein
MGRRDSNNKTFEVKKKNTAVGKGEQKYFSSFFVVKKAS